jgi:CRISPR/Cas system-associated protein Csm6
VAEPTTTAEQIAPERELSGRVSANVEPEYAAFIAEEAAAGRISAADVVREILGYGTPIYIQERDRRRSLMRSPQAQRA